MAESSPLRTFPSQRPMFERLLAMPLEQRLLQPVEMIPFCHRVYAFCYKNKVKTLGELVGFQKSQLRGDRNIGIKTLEHIEIYLAAAGLSLNGCEDQQPEELPDMWLKGATAMRRLILSHLQIRRVEPEVLAAVRRLPIPVPMEQEQAP